MKRIIVALVCVNLGLAAFLGYAYVKRPAYQTPPPTEEAALPETKTISSSAKSPPAVRPLKLSKNDKFDWRALASPNLRQYAANLRAVQCPEETIRDIMLAEVNRQYGSREALLKVRPEDRQPWEVVPTSEKRSNESKLRQLLLEKRDLLRELAGVDVPIETPPTLAGRNIEKFEGAYNELPEAKREQVRAIQEKYWGQSDDIKRRTIGFLEPEDREEYARIKTERRQELAKLLTPEELENYEIKTSATATALRSRMSGFNPSDEEFRSIFRLTQPLDEEYSLITGTRDREDKVAEAKRKEVEQHLQAQVRAALGEERYTEMERSRDPTYQNMIRAAEKAGVTRESALQAYEAQKVMRDEFSKVFQDPNLSMEERQQAAAAMQAEAEQTLQSILGEQAFEALRRANPGQFGGQAFRQRIATDVVRAPKTP